MTTYPSNFKKLEVQRRQLEQLWQPAAPNVKKSAGNWLYNAGKWLLKSLTEGDQPRIWTTQTAQGTHWCVHNPGSDRHHQFESEDALRMWLEQRYYTEQHLS